MAANALRPPTNGSLSARPAMWAWTEASSRSSCSVCSRASISSGDGVHRPFHVDDLAKGEQGLRAAPSGGGRREHLAQDRLRAAWIPCAHQRPGGRHHQDGPAVRLRRQRRTLAEQGASDRRRSATEGDLGGIGKCVGGSGIRSVDGSRHEERSLDRIVGLLGDGKAERPSLGRRGVGIGRRAEQRVRRPQSATLGHENAHSTRLVDARSGLVPEHPIEEAERGGRGGGDDDQARVAPPGSGRRDGP